ncbi:Lumazine-binding protein [Suillus tomentosus]|nr:Lumazine-binding protein [Suillus tomentosus]
MFTGLIEHLGTVSALHRDDGGCALTISQSAPILVDCHIGDSIAVNGACLTVVEFDVEHDGGYFKIWLANETLSRTDLGNRGDRKVGDQVNLERAMGAHVRFGGHFVQAHVDITATILKRTLDGDSLRLWFQLPEPTAERPSLLPYIIPKGYVTIDGASLTVTSVDDAERTFGVMLIQHTQQKITLAKKANGERVNIEVDMVGKYVEKSVLAALEGGGGEAMRTFVQRIVEETLVNKGILPFAPVSNDSGSM